MEDCVTLELEITVRGKEIQGGRFGRSVNASETGSHDVSLSRRGIHGAPSVCINRISSSYALRLHPFLSNDSVVPCDQRLTRKTARLPKILIQVGESSAMRNGKIKLAASTIRQFHANEMVQRPGVNSTFLRKGIERKTKEIVACAHLPHPIVWTGKKCIIRARATSNVSIVQYDRIHRAVASSYVTSRRIVVKVSLRTTRELFIIRWIICDKSEEMFVRHADSIGSMPLKVEFRSTRSPLISQLMNDVMYR